MMTRSLALLLVLAACGEKDSATDDTGTPADDSGTDDSATEDDTGTTGPTDAGGTIEEAQSVEFTESGLLAEETIGFGGDRDFFAFEAVAGDYISLATVAYGLTGAVVADTVLRLYDADGNFLTENDDMPYRFQQTDSAIYFQAAYDGTYYVEVLEWSDWADDSPTGGSDYEYLLYGFTITSFDVFDNDRQSDADDLADDETVLFHGSQFDDYSINFFGHFDEGDDVDIWPIDFDGGSYYQFSFWPTYIGDAELALSIYNEDWELLAYTEEPEIGTGYTVMYDIGVATLTPAGRLYVQVENLSGDYGAGNFYAGVVLGYTDAFATEEEEPNDEASFANGIEMTESTNTANYYYGRAHGNVEGFDDADVWSITSNDVGSMNGRYLNVQMMAENAGSLGYFTIRVYDADGNLLGEADTSPADGSFNPELWDIELPDTGSVTIRIYPDDVSEDALYANQYFVWASVSDDPVN